MVRGGTGTTIVVSDGTSAPAAFRYEYEVSCCASGSWDFDTVATAPRTVVLKYSYTGYHAFFQVRVGLNAVVGATTYPLVNAGPVNCCTPPSGGFSYTGTVALPVQAGDIYGFTLSGKNFDSDGRLQGTLVVDELSKNDCKEGGWKTILDTSGNPLFTNQGDCVSFVETGGLNDPGQNIP